MVICTIGFSKKSLRDFVARLQNAGVKRIIDVRLNNTSQLAGYAKKQDLEYILELVGIEYAHHPELAPTDLLMKDYKEKRVTWTDFVDMFNKMLDERKPLTQFLSEKEPEIVCLLCAEDKPDHCHRILVAEYIKEKIPGIQIRHL